jgi:4-amino-4-deoxy-L-arabinose transferase-like glycosyltransferase
MNRRDAAILAALVVVGALLRAPLLGEGFWRDEASTYYDIAAKGLSGTLAMIVRIELAPPAYFLVEKLWAHVAGVGTVALKLPSFAYGLALIVATYSLGRAAASRPVGLVAAAFASVSQPAIELSAEARVYAFAALAAALALAAYARALRAPQPTVPLAWFVAFGIVLAYSNYAGSVLLGLLAAATTYILLRRRDSRRLAAFAGAFALIGLAYAPWLPVMFEHARIGAPFQERTRLDTFANVVNNDFGHLLPLAGRHGQIGLAFALGALIWLVVTVLRGVRGKPSEAPGAVAALGFCTIAGASLEALLSLREPRYMLVFAPGAWVWLAWLACRLWTWLAGARRWQQIAVGTVALLTIAWIVPAERLARAAGPSVSSGISDLAPRAIALEREHRTLCLTAPDYLAPTFGYYVSRETGAPVYGFARWSDPQIFETRGYRDVWTDPAVLTAVEGRVARLMGGRYDRLCLIRDAILIDRASMPYSRANALFAWLRAHYQKISSQEYPGKQEDVIMEEFRRAATSPR